MSDCAHNPYTDSYRMANVLLKVKGLGRTVQQISTYYVIRIWLMFSTLMKYVGLSTNNDRVPINEQSAGKRAKVDTCCWKFRGSDRTPLQVAAYDGDQALVKSILENKNIDIDINEQDYEGKTALMLAAQNGHNSIVAELVKAGADTSVKDRKGMTAVLLARNYDVIRQLIQENGDVERLSREDRSHILWHACNEGELNMVQCVIKAGCDVDHFHEGQTPVMMATLRGHDRIVKELILANCDVNLKGDVVFWDLALSLNFARLIQSKNTFSMAVLVYILLPWIQFQMEVVAAMFTDPMGFLVLLMMLIVVILGTQLMPRSWTIMMLHSAVIAIAVTVAMIVAAVLGPMTWATSLMAIVTIPLVRQGRRATVAAVIREVAGTLVYVTLGMVAALVTLFSLPEIFKWSPWDMTVMQMVAVVLIIVVRIRIWKMLSKRTVLLKAFLKLMFLNVEFFVMALSCMMMGSKAFFLQTVQSVMELLVTAIIFWCFLLIMLTTQATEAVMYRGVVGFFAFEMMKLLEMENALVSPDKVRLVSVLAVLLLVRGLVEAIGLVKVQVTVAKKAVLLEGLVLLLHLVVAVVEAYLALVISKEGAELQLRSINVENIVTVLVTLTVAASIKADVSALHYAASYCCIECGNLLVKAGADVLAKNVYFRNSLQIGSESFVNKVQMVLSFTTRKVIIVIGNSACGKSTLVAALERTSNSLWKTVLNYFKKVHVRQRRGGIEVVTLSNQKYGEALIYDFAGPSQYHSPHQSFLEAMLSRPGVAVTLLLVVKTTEEEDTITQQLHRWLQPLAQRSAPCMPLVIVVGSFLDQVKSERVARNKLLRCTQLVQKELLLNIGGTFLLDCRQCESRAINQICSFLQVVPSVCTNSLSYNLHWVLVKVRKTFKRTLALQLHKFETWMQNKKEAGKLPRNLPSSEKVCQDLSAAGHTLFLRNKEHPSHSWLILDLPALLHQVYGTLFSGSQVKVNQFGLLHCSQLTELFPQFNQELIQDVLISLEFCIEVDSLLLKEELLQLTIDEREEGWLYFPALVSAQPCKVFPEDPDPNQFRWMCWQLRTEKKHFIGVHLLLTIILRLAANHVFTRHTVRQHCCSVWVNDLSWSPTKGVDVAVQISDSNVIQVIGGSKAGPEKLQKYTAAIVQDVIKTITQLSPKLEAKPYIVHPYTHTLWEDPKAAQPHLLYPVLDVIACISCSEDYTLSPSPNSSSVPIGQLFGGESPSQSTVQHLDYPGVAQDGE